LQTLAGVASNFRKWRNCDLSIPHRDVSFQEAETAVSMADMTARSRLLWSGRRM